LRPETFGLSRRARDLRPLAAARAR